MNEFVEDKKGLYFLGRLESNNITIKRINNVLAEYFNDFGLMKNGLQDWASVFEYLYEKSKNRKIVMVIDEFPFIVDRFPEILSVLQDKLDNFLSKSKTKLILCGSSVSMMEKYTWDYKSALYGRRTGQWKLTKIHPSYLKEFYPDRNVKDLIMIYSVIDTIPGYFVKFDGKNVEERFLRKYFQKESFCMKKLIFF